MNVGMYILISGVLIVLEQSIFFTYKKKLLQHD